MELTTGIWTNTMLATWFGVSEASFRSSKRKRLEELQNYCEFEEVKGKINIKKVFNSNYVKKRSDKYKKVKDNIDIVWSENGLDSCKRVTDDLLKRGDVALAPSTAYNYVREARNELYGKPFDSHGGPLGRCAYLWCKKGPDGYLEFFDEEEQKIKDELKKKYFGDTNEKAFFVKGMIDSGEIKKEEAWALLESLTGLDSHFMDFLLELQFKIGAQVVRGTYVERNGAPKLVELEGAWVDED